MSATTGETIGVVGLWHLGCVIAASWHRLGYRVRGVDFEPTVVRGLSEGRPPLYEPGLAEAIGEGVRAQTLTFSTDAAVLRECSVVFLAYDTPVDVDDRPDLSILDTALQRMAPHLRPEAIVVVSAQIPAGTARQWRRRLQEVHPTIEVVYSPENLRLGEAMTCYRRPGHVVIGAESAAATTRIVALFAPMEAECVTMNLPSAELTKHGINAFLATSITFANQLADACEVVGGDIAAVAAAMKRDPRIGAKAYLAAGVGFSGGTLGRDLQVLERMHHESGARFPLFGDLWRYNRARVQVVAAKVTQALGGVSDRCVALLGMTYKPGTSTLRQSLPLAVAYDLTARGAVVRSYDPRADWSEVSPPPWARCASVDEAVTGADVVVLMTEWPEFQTLNGATLRQRMRGHSLFDPKGFLRPRYAELRRQGLQILQIGAPVEDGSC